MSGAGYTFWGGREGYMTLLNTDIKREQEHLARFLHLAVAYKKQIGFKGQFYIEPKPKEPTKHQYDSDAAACLNFLREYDLLPHFKLNIETNHATLAGHSMQHELEVAGAANALGSIDANTGDELLGWDTDQFPTNIYLTTYTMLSILKYGGLTTGGVNFDFWCCAGFDWLHDDSAICAARRAGRANLSETGGNQSRRQLRISCGKIFHRRPVESIDRTRAGEQS